MLSGVGSTRFFGSRVSDQVSSLDISFGLFVRGGFPPVVGAKQQTTGPAKSRDFLFSGGGVHRRAAGAGTPNVDSQRDSPGRGPSWCKRAGSCEALAGSHPR